MTDENLKYLINNIQFYTGSGLPGTSLGKNLDIYKNTATGVFYRKYNDVWSNAPEDVLNAVMVYGISDYGIDAISTNAANAAEQMRLFGSSGGIFHAPDFVSGSGSRSPLYVNVEKSTEGVDAVEFIGCERGFLVYNDDADNALQAILKYRGNQFISIDVPSGSVLYFKTVHIQHGVRPVLKSENITELNTMTELTTNYATPTTPTAISVYGGSYKDCNMAFFSTTALLRYCFYTTPIMANGWNTLPFVYHFAFPIAASYTLIRGYGGNLACGGEMDCPYCHGVGSGKYNVYAFEMVSAQQEVIRIVNCCDGKKQELLDSGWALINNL